MSYTRPLGIATLSPEIMQAMAQAVAMALQQVGVAGGPGSQGRKQGQAIDRHDVVIRFNDGPTAGFEK